MIWAQIIFDIFILAIVGILWIGCQAIAKSHYDFTQWTRQKLDKLK
jgi:hypothetical protein